MRIKRPLEIFAHRIAMACVLSKNHTPLNAYHGIVHGVLTAMYAHARRNVTYGRQWPDFADFRSE